MMTMAFKIFTGRDSMEDFSKVLIIVLFVLFVCVLL